MGSATGIRGCNNMNDRQKELAEKKQRLAELRLARQKKEAAKHGGLENDRDATSSSAATASRQTMSQKELDELLLNVGLQPRAPSPHRMDHHSHYIDGVSSTDANGPTLSNGHGSRSSFPLQVLGHPSTLEIHSIHPISVAPKNGVQQMACCKTTQTDDERVSIGEFSMGSQELAFDDEMGSVGEADDSGTTIAGGNAGGGGIGVGVFDDLPSREIRKHLSQLQFHSVHSQHHGTHAAGGVMGMSMATLSHSQHPQQPVKPPELSEEEKKQILASAEFNRFFARNAKVIERALTEDVDIFVYVNGPIVEAGAGEMLTLSRVFHMEKLTAGRPVTALDLSHHYPELLAVAYDQCVDGAPGAPEGLVCVWNTRFHSAQPELQPFHNSSRITSMIFDAYSTPTTGGGRELRPCAPLRPELYSPKSSEWDEPAATLAELKLAASEDMSAAQAQLLSSTAPTSLMGGSSGSAAGGTGIF